MGERCDLGHTRRAVMDIAVYHDLGSGELSRGCLLHALASAYAGRARVRRIFADELCASDEWHARTRLLALPGGADRPYCEKLDGRGNASIRRFIEAGGKLLGMCAGAYYSCARIAWEAARPGEITGQRELALFAGTGRGSLHELAEPYALDHLRCAALVPVHAPGAARTLSALYWGGPELVPDSGARYTPLLTYAFPDGRSGLAAARMEVGRGRVVLCGVHTEITGAQLACEVSRQGDDSFEHGMQLCLALQRADAERQAAFDLLLGALDADELGAA